MTFPARYPGTCSECGGRFHTNDMIRRADDDEGWAHDTCTDTDHTDPCAQAAAATQWWLEQIRTERGTA